MGLRPTGKMVAYSMIVSFVLSTVAVGLRGLVRYRQWRTLLDSDWVCLVAFGFFIVYSALVFHMVYNPAGTIDINALSKSELEKIWPLGTLTHMFFCIIACLAKVSLLLFWKDIFISTSFRRRNYVVMGLTVCWGIITSFVVAFQCNPVSAGWSFDRATSSKLPPAKCLPVDRVIVGAESSNIILDFLIIGLPIAELRKLKMSRGKKVGAAFIFVLGGVVVLAGVLRMYYSINTETITRPLGFKKFLNFPPAYLWTNIQMAAAIICCCLPTLPPLVRGYPIGTFFTRTTTYFRALKAPSRTWMRSHRSLQSPRDSECKEERRRYGGPQLFGDTKLSSKASAKAWDSGEHDILAPDQIYVRRDIYVEQGYSDSISL